MTEADWLAATDPAPMLEFVRGKANERPERLVASLRHTNPVILFVLSQWPFPLCPLCLCGKS